MILRLEDFKCEAYIPGLLQESDLASPFNDVVRNTVLDFISKYEPQFIRDFGLSKEDKQEVSRYVENEEKGQPEIENANNRAKCLVSRLRFSLSHYISFFFFRKQTMTPIGTVSIGSENGQRTSPADTQVLLWNQMAENNRELYTELYGKGHPDTEVFRNINAIGL